MRVRTDKIEHQVGQLCPSCYSTDYKKKRGILIKRKGKFGEFLGCNMFPNCGYSCKIDKDLHEEASQLLSRKGRKHKKNKKNNY